MKKKALISVHLISFSAAPRPWESISMIPTFHSGGILAYIMVDTFVICLSKPQRTSLVNAGTVIWPNGQ